MNWVAKPSNNFVEPSCTTACVFEQPCTNYCSSNCSYCGVRYCSSDDNDHCIIRLHN